MKVKHKPKVTTHIVLPGTTEADILSTNAARIARSKQYSAFYRREDWVERLWHEESKNPNSRSREDFLLAPLHTPSEVQDNFRLACRISVIKQMLARSIQQSPLSSELKIDAAARKLKRAASKMAIGYA